MLNPAKTKHHYLIIRHGESTANVQHLIITDPKVGCVKYGLTQKGVEQSKSAAKAINELCDKYGFRLEKDVLIFCSDFKRTKETAMVIGKELSIGFNENKLLRERRFGMLDKNDGSIDYTQVWKFDELNADHNTFGVESVNSVLKRMKQFMIGIENDYKTYPNRKLIVMISHGDVCQITQTLFENINPSFHHKRLSYINNAEVRDLTAIAISRNSKL